MITIEIFEQQLFLNPSIPILNKSIKTLNLMDEQISMLNNVLVENVNNLGSGHNTYAVVTYPDGSQKTFKCFDIYKITHPELFDENGNAKKIVNRVLLHGSYGNAEPFTEECMQFLTEHGLSYPECMNCRHDKVLLEMFDKFSVPYNSEYPRVLWSGDSKHPSFYYVKELRGKKYCIDVYDGQETAVEPDEIEWFTI